MTSYAQKLSEYADYCRWREKRVKELREKVDKGNILSKKEQTSLMMLETEMLLQEGSTRLIMGIGQIFS